LRYPLQKSDDTIGDFWEASQIQTLLSIASQKMTRYRIKASDPQMDFQDVSHTLIPFMFIPPKIKRPSGIRYPNTVTDLEK